MRLWQTEPALIIGLINAAIALGVGFGLKVTPEQVGLINAFVAAGLAIWTRQQVVPVATVQAVVSRAVGAAS